MHGTFLFLCSINSSEKKLVNNMSGEKIGFQYEPNHEKTYLWVSAQVRHKQGCTTTEDDYSYGLKFWDVGSRGIVLS